MEVFPKWIVTFLLKKCEEWQALSRCKTRTYV